MEDKNFTPEQSLQLIQQMIVEAKKELSDNGFLYLLWGWLVFISAAGNYMMLQMNITNAFITWPILMPLGGIISMIYGISQRKKNKRQAKTIIDHVMSYVWMAFGVCLLVTLLISSKIGWETAYPFIMLLYGIGTFISGGVMKFKPLIIGGIVCWAGGALAFFVDFEFQLLILIVVIVVAYIIPGHILKSQYKKNV